jgi:hypothetical protein
MTHVRSHYQSGRVQAASEKKKAQATETLRCGSRPVTIQKAMNKQPDNCFIKNSGAVAKVRDR